MFLTCTSSDGRRRTPIGLWHTGSAHIARLRADMPEPTLRDQSRLLCRQYHPVIALQTDEAWLKEHAFWIEKNGEVARRSAEAKLLGRLTPSIRPTTHNPQVTQKYKFWTEVPPMKPNAIRPPTYRRWRSRERRSRHRRLNSQSGQDDSEECVKSHPSVPWTSPSPQGTQNATDPSPASH